MYMTGKSLKIVFASGLLNRVTFKENQERSKIRLRSFGIANSTKM